jgi:hypothetical protein
MPSVFWNTKCHDVHAEVPLTQSIVASFFALHIQTPSQAGVSNTLLKSVNACMYINWHIMPRALSRKTQLSLFQHGVLYILFQNSTCAHIPKNTYVQSRHTLAEHMHTYVRTHIDICIENNLHAQLVFAQTAVGSVRTPD